MMIWRRSDSVAIGANCHVALWAFTHASFGSLVCCAASGVAESVSRIKSERISADPLALVEAVHIGTYWTRSYTGIIIQKSVVAVRDLGTGILAV